MDGTPARRILVCTVPEMIEIVQSCLNDLYACDICLTIQQAREGLERKPDLLLCNVQFDESRMFDFLTYVRAHPVGRSLPIVISHTKDVRTPALHRSIEAAARTIGIHAFIDGPQVVQQHGMQGAKENLRNTIAAVLAGTPLPAAAELPASPDGTPAATPCSGLCS
jgi:CheY-like chemotaxis protein